MKKFLAVSLLVLAVLLVSCASYQEPYQAFSDYYANTWVLGEHDLRYMERLQALEGSLSDGIFFTSGNLTTEQALTFAWEPKPGEVVITTLPLAQFYFIIDETLILLSKKASRNLAFDFGEKLFADELVEIVETSRKAMVDRLTKQKIQDPLGRVDEHGAIRMIDNPFYRKMHQKEAEKIAEDHIKATIDTMHLQRWMQHFKRKPGQTEGDREREFYDWYGQEMGKIRKKNILGHIHVSDGHGYDFSHLPLGQGKLLDFFPAAKAIDELRGMGLSVTHEGWGEGPERMLSEWWRATNKPIYGLPSGDMSFADISDRYLGGTNAPPYLFGELATDKDDFHLWSEVPLE